MNSIKNRFTLKLFFPMVVLATVWVAVPGWSQLPPVQWKTLPSKAYHFSFQTPYPLYLPKHSVASALILDNRTTAQLPVFHLSVTASHHLFGPEIHDVKDMPEWMFNTMKMGNEIPEHQTTDQLVRIASGQEGILTRGTCKDFNGTAKQLLMLNVKRNEECWVVLILYDPESPTQEKMAERVVRSFRILD